MSKKKQNFCTNGTSCAISLTDKIQHFQHYFEHLNRFIAILCVKQNVMVVLETLVENHNGTMHQQQVTQKKNFIKIPKLLKKVLNRKNVSIIEQRFKYNL